MEELFSNLVRLLACGLTLALLPIRLIPISVRLAFAVSIFILSLPSDFALGLAQIVSSFGQSNSNLVPVSTERLVVDLSLGILTAVSLSAPAYVFELFAGQLRSLITTKAAKTDCFYAVNDSLRVLIMLLAASFWFSSQSFSELVFSLNSLLGISAEALGSGAASAFKVITLEAAKVSLTSAAVLLIPFFVLSLSIDFVLLVMNRLFYVLSSPAISASVRVMLVVFMLSLSLYGLSNQAQSLLVNSSRQSNSRLTAISENSTASTDANRSGVADE